MRPALFMASSGHSGVERIARNLIPEISRQGLAVDPPHAAGQGPTLDEVPERVPVVQPGSAYITPLAHDLRRKRPGTQRRSNRVALLAIRFSVDKGARDYLRVLHLTAEVDRP